MDTAKTITHVSLCAGYGGIDLGLRGAIGNLRTVAFCEIEAFACANLVAKMEERQLDAAPIWTNLKTFPWGSFRDRVDILSGGYPCQPFSAAGKRLGTEDPRHLWPYIADGIRIMRPRICFFENVEGHISLGLEAVITELEGMGYRTTWGIFSASEVGAPHQRKRVFILATLGDSQFEGLEGLVQSDGYEEGRQDEDRSAIEAGVRDWRRVVFADECDECDCCDEVICPTCKIHYWECGCPGPTQDGIEYGEDRNGVLYGRSRTVWPSRPREPQHEWEPPRVVSSR